jgi:hypothetical protein
MHNGVSNQLTGDQDHIIPRRTKLPEPAKLRADDRGSSAPAFNVERQDLA